MQCYKIRLARSFQSLGSLVFLPFCPACTLGRRNSFARSRGHRPPFRVRPSSLRLSIRTSETSQGRQRRVQLLHFPLHAHSFLLQLPGYSSQVRHGSPRSGSVPAHQKLGDSPTRSPAHSRFNTRSRRWVSFPWSCMVLSAAQPLLRRCSRHKLWRAFPRPPPRGRLARCLALLYIGLGGRFTRFRDLY